MCIWVQRHMFITIIWPEYPPLFDPFKDDKGSKVGSYDFFSPPYFLKGESIATWAIPVLQHDWNKGRKMGEKLLFQPHKAFLPSCGRIATGSGSVFFHSGGCLVLCSSQHTHTHTFSFFKKKKKKIQVIICRNSKPALKVSRPGELWGQGWRQIS